MWIKYLVFVIVIVSTLTLLIRYRWYRQAVRERKIQSVVLSLLYLLTGGCLSSLIIGKQNHLIYDNARFGMLPGAYLSNLLLLAVAFPVSYFIFVTGLTKLGNYFISGILLLIWAAGVHLTGHTFYLPPEGAGTEFSNYFASDTKEISLIMIVISGFAGGFMIVDSLRPKSKNTRTNARNIG